MQTVNLRDWTWNEGRQIGAEGIALIIVLPLTAVLVAVTLLHTPSPPVSGTAVTGSRSTGQSAPTNPSSSATATTGTQSQCRTNDSSAGSRS